MTTPCPPHRVESASLGVPIQLSISCQLFIAQTFPAGSTAISVSICRPPPTYPFGGEICPPVCTPGGQCSVRTPHNSTIGLLAAAKLEIQMLSLPSTATAHGPGKPPLLNGEPGYGVPSGRSIVTLPPFMVPPFCCDIVFVR